MILYHATPTQNVDTIMREGLRPQENGSDIDPVHLSERDMSDFIYGLFDLRPGGMWEFEHGAPDTVTLFAVEVAGLLLENPGCDGDDHYMSHTVLEPWRLKIVGTFPE